MKAEHYAVGLVFMVLGGGQAKSLTSSSDLSAKIEAQGVELSKKFDAQGATLKSLELALIEIKARGEASDKAVDRLATELSRIGQDSRDLRDGQVRSATRQEEHERRITALEGKK